MTVGGFHPTELENNSVRDQSFWNNRLATAETMRQAFIQEIGKLTQWAQRGAHCLHGDGVFVCFRKFNRHDKAKLIRLQRKLKQLETTKIPFYQEKLK